MIFLNNIKKTLGVTALFYFITQRVVVIAYRRFGTTHTSHLKGSRYLVPCRWDRDEELLCSGNLKSRKALRISVVITLRWFSSCLIQQYRIYNCHFFTETSFKLNQIVTNVLFWRYPVRFSAQTPPLSSLVFVQFSSGITGKYKNSN